MSMFVKIPTKFALYLAGVASVVAGCNDDETTTHSDTSTHSGTGSSTNTNTTTNSTLTPVYVTVGMHIEYHGAHDKPGCDPYLGFRAELLEYATFFETQGVLWNLQVSLPFVDKMVTCDVGTVTDDTAGKNVLRYLVEDTATLVDPHSHETPGEDTYPDIVAALINAGIDSDTLIVAGGFETNNTEQFANFTQGYTGPVHGYKWQPTVVTYAAVPQHPVEQEDFSSGLWRPSGFDYPGPADPLYYQHKNTGPFFIAGMGFLHSCAFTYKQGYFWQASDYIATLVDFIDQGTLPAGKIYTATLALPSSFNDASVAIPKIQEQLDELAPLVTAGKVVYVHFQDLPTIWSDNYGGSPNTVTIDQFANYHTCDGNGGKI